MRSRPGSRRPKTRRSCRSHTRQRPPTMPQRRPRRATGRLSSTPPQLDRVRTASRCPIVLLPCGKVVGPRGYYLGVSTPRERTEQIEHNTLSPNATLASATKGREQDEPQDNLRTCFQRDRDRILHSKAFRRLKHKTQVFLAPEGDHYRVRLTHTLEVSQIARTAARALGLNEDLTEAIAMGHDLGHTPFGHL